jgi:uncharacterized membrane protein
MTDMFFHPKIVHVPMALAVLMPLVAAAMLLAWWRGWVPARTWALATGLQAVLVVSALLAMRSGERDEEVVERVVAERFIEAHEEAAESFLVSAGVVLAAAVAGLILSKRRAGLPLAGLATAGTLVVLVLGYRVGQAGGELVYVHGAAAAHAAQAGRAPGAAASTPTRDDDD